MTQTEEQRRGRRSRAKGKAFEELLDKTFAYYSSKGYAQIDKTPEPMKPMMSEISTLYFFCAFRQ